MSTAEELVAAVRELHAPIREGRSRFAQCHGCDQGPHPEDYPEWPCSTAEIVYTPDEVLAVSTPGGAQ